MDEVLFAEAVNRLGSAEPETTKAALRALNSQLSDQYDALITGKEGSRPLVEALIRGLEARLGRLTGAEFKEDVDVLKGLITDIRSLMRSSRPPFPSKTTSQPLQVKEPPDVEILEMKPGATSDFSAEERHAIAQEGDADRAFRRLFPPRPEKGPEKGRRIKVTFNR